MGWDLNPREDCSPAGFQDRCLQPLSHPSIRFFLRLGFHTFFTQSSVVVATRGHNSENLIARNPLIVVSKPDLCGGVSVAARVTARGTYRVTARFVKFAMRTSNETIEYSLNIAMLF